MTVNNDIIRRFTELVNQKETPTPTDVYGTITFEQNQMKVKIDGNDTPIPIVNDNGYTYNERVKVTINNNRFIVSPLR